MYNKDGPVLSYQPIYNTNKATHLQYKQGNYLKATGLARQRKVARIRSKKRAVDNITNKFLSARLCMQSKLGFHYWIGCNPNFSYRFIGFSPLGQILRLGVSIVLSPVKAVVKIKIIWVH